VGIDVARFAQRVLAETEVKERFTEHDLRAKCASDADSLEHARALLSHADSKITERVNADGQKSSGH
jgi:integrase